MNNPSYVESADGTAIAFDRLGDGQPLVIVSGMFCTRARTVALADAIAGRVGGTFGVVNYDRRGRGDSGDTAPYAVEREVDDLRALIEATGGSAAVYGHSSGAGLALRAAAQGAPIALLVLHEPPFGPDDPDSVNAARRLADIVRAAILANRPGDAITAFLVEAGMPEDVVASMSSDPDVLAVARTMPYDLEVMGDFDRGGTIPQDLARSIDIPTLLIDGAASPDFFRETTAQLASLIPGSTRVVLEGHGHDAPAAEVAPVVADFLHVSPGA